jgi:hypothetical protein
MQTIPGADAHLVGGPTEVSPGRPGDVAAQNRRFGKFL